MREVGGVNPLILQAMAGLTVMVLWTAAYAKVQQPRVVNSEFAGRTRTVTRHIHSIKGKDLCTMGRLSSAACLEKLP
jgi:hypothetical protein